MRKERTTVTLSYDEEKITALGLYLEEKKLRLEDELTRSLDTLYVRAVPQSVRHYIDLRNGTVSHTVAPLQKQQFTSYDKEVKRDGE